MTSVLIAAALAAVLALPLQAADILSRLVQSQQTSAYRGEQMVATWDGKQSQTTLVRTEHDPPEWTRLEYAPVGSSAGRVILRHGGAEIQYDPRSMVGTTRRRPAESGDDVETTHLAWLRSSYAVTSRPVRLLGRPAHRVDFSPRSADRPSRRLYVDDATGAILRSERTAQDGRLGEITVFITFEPMARGWRAGMAPPSNLKLTPERDSRPVTAADAERITGQKLVTFTPPAGFHLLGLFRVEEHPAVLQSVYSDGISTLVLTQRRGRTPHPPGETRVVETGGGPVWLHVMGLRTLAHWTSSGWLLTLVGDIAPDAMVTAARGTGVSPAPRILDRLVHWLRTVRHRLLSTSPEFRGSVR